TADNTKQGLFARQTLDDIELADIKALADICASYEDLDLRLSWSELRSRDSDVPGDLLYYEDGRLVGFLALAGVGDREAEVAGMVRRGYRRQGVFTELVDEAQEICRRRGTYTLLFVFDHRSDSARAFLASIGAGHAFSEHRMQLDTPAARSVPTDAALDFKEA